MSLYKPIFPLFILLSDVANPRPRPLFLFFLSFLACQLPPELMLSIAFSVWLHNWAPPQVTLVRFFPGVTATLHNVHTHCLLCWDTWGHGGVLFISIFVLVGWKSGNYTGLLPCSWHSDCRPIRSTTAKREQPCVWR